MANDLSLRVLFVTAGVALGLAAPAQAQFMSGAYPVITVPPPPAQSMVMPARPKPRPAPPVVAAPPPDASPPQQLHCQYHGQTRVCE
jgi:hypothetical protein